MRSPSVGHDLFSTLFTVHSLLLPLHLYPTFALSILSTPLLDLRQQEKIIQYENLITAHSRMILVLQSMVHSSQMPIPSELDDARWRTSSNLYSGLRELIFPAPLSYFSPQPSEKQSPPMPYGKDGKHARRSSMPPERARLKNQRYHHQLSLSSASEDGAAALTVMRHHRSHSQLSTAWADANFAKPRGKVPPPPPLEEPESLRLYSSRRRRRLIQSTAAESEDENLFKPPSRRFISTNISSDSSIGSAPTRLSSYTNTSVVPQSQSSYTSGSSISSTSPHDLHVATSRTRAPVLRVFVPCTDLSEESIALCEQQLARNSLWEHLSVGDIICNLGYIPPTDEEDALLNGNTNSADQQKASGQRQHWLIYTTEGLQPYCPTDAPPISDSSDC